MHSYKSSSCLICLIKGLMCRHWVKNIEFQKQHCTSLWKRNLIFKRNCRLQIENFKQNYEDSLTYRNFICKLIKPPTYPVTIPIIWRKFYEKFKLDINPRKLKSFLKDDLGFSFKKSSSATPNIKESEDLLMKKIFSLDALNSIYDNILINIDEMSF